MTFHSLSIFLGFSFLRKEKKKKLQMSEDTSEDVTFIHKHKKFVVKQIDAKNASRKIFNIWMSDSLFDEMNIDD